MATEPLSKKRRLEDVDSAAAIGAEAAAPPLKPWLFVTGNDMQTADVIEFDPNSTPKHAEITAWFVALLHEERELNNTARKGLTVYMFVFEPTLRAALEGVTLPHEDFPDARTWPWTTEELGSWRKVDIFADPAARECSVVFYTTSF